jgi:hypothetical protein
VWLCPEFSVALRNAAPQPGRATCTALEAEATRRSEPEHNRQSEASEPEGLFCFGAWLGATAKPLFYLKNKKSHYICVIILCHEKRVW